MEEQTAHRRHISGGIACLAAGAFGLVVAVPASASVAGDREPFREFPVHLDGDPTCEDIRSTWTGLKVDPPSDGEHSDGTLTVQITISNGEDGQRLDWSSNIGVDAVIVAGGSHAHNFGYDPEATEDTGLFASFVPEDERFADISRVSFCYDQELPPPGGGEEPKPEPEPEVAPIVEAQPTFTG